MPPSLTWAAVGWCHSGFLTATPDGCPCPWLQQAAGSPAWVDLVLQAHSGRLVFTVFFPHGQGVPLPFDSYSAMVGGANVVPVSFGSSWSHKASTIFPTFGIPLKSDSTDRVICTWWWSSSEAYFQDFSSYKSWCRGCQAPMAWRRRQSLSSLHPIAVCNAQTHTKNNLQISDISAFFFGHTVSIPH